MLATYVLLMIVINPPAPNELWILDSGLTKTVCDDIKLHLPTETRPMPLALGPFDPNTMTVAFACDPEGDD